MLTNEHVVRRADFVTIRLTTGREIIGQVIATDAKRDAALVKVERTGLRGLPLRRDAVPVGSDVFAAGSPLDPSLDVTVSKGTLSAYRIQDRLNFTQSDVNVLPGSSGGPLLDENGNVIGITTSGPMLQGVTTGLNVFVPISEAVQAVELRPTSVAAVGTETPPSSRSTSESHSCEAQGASVTRSYERSGATTRPRASVSAGCTIKGNIEKNGERHFCLPRDRWYKITRVVSWRTVVLLRVSRIIAPTLAPPAASAYRPT